MALIPRGSNAAAVAGVYSNIRTGVTSFGLEANFKRIDKLGGEVRERAKIAVQKATEDILGETQLNIRVKNIIKTGFMLNSVTASSSLDGFTGYVNVGAHYGIYWEFGTRYRAAKPFLGPAVDLIGPGFIAAIRQAIREGTGDK